MPRLTKNEIIFSFAFLVLFCASALYLVNLLYRLLICHQTFLFDLGFIFPAFGFFSFGMILFVAYWVYNLKGNPEVLEQESAEDVD
jgi:hypothetical protein